MKSFAQFILRVIIVAVGLAVQITANAGDLLKGEIIASPAVDYTNGSKDSNQTGPNSAKCAFDGDNNSFYASYDRSNTWVGLDLGKPHVISMIAFTPRTNYAYRMELGLFQGANNPDFSDAVPLYIIDAAPKEQQLTRIRVSCSRGFRYVRYVGPNGQRCNVAEVAFYGDPGEGDDTQFYTLSDVATVSITTTDNREITSKTEYLYGIGTFISADGKSIHSDSLKIRGRGNASWSFDQKPYKFKLFNKKKLLGIDCKAKEWTLINNWRDKTFLRNPLAYEIAHRIGMPYAPHYQLVDVIVNGEYRGCYLLSDQVEVHSKRIPITEMTPDDIDGEALTGGYHIEIDAYAGDEPQKFYSSRFGTPVTIKYPKDDKIQTKQFNYIRNLYNTLEMRIWASNYKSPTSGYVLSLDAESFVKRFIVEELMGNTDAYYSVHMYKERNDPKFYFSPVWDFDLSADNDSRTYPINGHSNYLYCSGTASNVSGMLETVSRIMEVERSNERLISIWSRACYEQHINKTDILNFIDSLATILERTQTLHFKRWKIMDQLLSLGTGVRGSYAGEITFLKNYFSDRFAWLDNKIGLYPEGVGTVTDTYAKGSILPVNNGVLLTGFETGARAEAFTAAGVKAASVRIKSKEDHISLPSGVYVVRITTSSGQTESAKVLVP